MVKTNRNKFGHDKCNLHQVQCDQREKSWPGQIRSLDMTKVICISLNVISVKKHGQDK